ncbi:hypothetical protein [Paraflavitalea speifideaquila]|uniref:hypothetical protein n=1 Tax=Paraflavitalea speifideaquila TaxID=3076558 RepID=UPI0028E9BF02|nr:hypothetical protein [Paraflavitalea speifideiaquila]
MILLLGLGGLIALCYFYKSGVSSFLKIGIWSAIFVILGYSTYFTTLVRSSANPSVDMYNVDNPVSLVGYLSREQYGDWPILYGPYFSDKPSQENFVITGDRYVKGKDKYEVAGKNGGIDYGSMPTAHLFPAPGTPTTKGNKSRYTAILAALNRMKNLPGLLKYVISSITNSVGCTGATLCGTLPVNKTTSRLR